MIYEEACRIMSLSGTEGKPEIKKRYRRLMHQVHPDALGMREPESGCAAWEINAAYEVLMERACVADRPKQEESGRTKNGRRWQAPVNEHAYIAREIYVDHICIDSGRYYYTEEEDFQMFLRSIYLCSKKVLEPFSDRIVEKHLGEVAYLLSQQFVNRQMILERYETDVGEKGTIYYFSAMLETEGQHCMLQPGTILAPGSVRNHRLYLNQLSGKEVGYLSFHDDIVYYALIPIFEQRKAEIKVRISGSILGNNRKRAVKVRTLDLWVLVLQCNWTHLEMQLSDQIAALIRRCQAEENA